MKERWYSLREASVKTGIPIEVLKEGISNGAISEWKEVHTLLGHQIRVSDEAIAKLVKKAEGSRQAKQAAAPAGAPRRR